MKLGYNYYRSSLIKLLILSCVLPFILRDFFSGKDTKSEPGAIYLIIVIWFLGVGFLVFQMRRTRPKKVQTPEARPEH